METIVIDAVNSRAEIISLQRRLKLAWENRPLLSFTLPFDGYIES